MKLTHIKSLALSAIALAFLSTSAFAQVSAIEGKVIGPDGAPVKDAVIKIERKDIKGNYTVKSDKKGHYGHYGLPLGTYKLSCEIGGKVVDSVDNVRTKLGDSTLEDFDARKSMAQQAALQKAAATGTLTKEQERSMSGEQKAAFEKANKAREAQLQKNKVLNDAFNQGKTALDAKQYDQAVDAFNKCVEMDPSQHVIYARLAEAYMGQAKSKPAAEQAPIVQKSLDAYKKAIELKPDEASYYNNYAIALANDKKIDEAKDALNKAVQLDPPGAARYYYNLGAVLTNTGQGEAAGDAFKKAIDADPKYAAAQYQYGLYLISKAQVAADGKVTPAPGTREALETYLQLDPTGPNAESAKGLLAGMEGTVTTKYENPAAAKKSSKKK